MIGMTFLDDVINIVLNLDVQSDETVHLKSREDPVLCSVIMILSLQPEQTCFQRIP